MAAIEVRALGNPDRPAAETILVDVFSDDPSWQRAIRSSRRIRPFLRRYYRRCLADLVPGSNADGAFEGDRLVGVALWFPPGQRPGGLPGRLHGLFDRQQRETRDEWLLEGIAVAAGNRGRGIGGTLLRHRLQGLSATVHLEATTDGSARLYERYGFVPDPHRRSKAGDLWMTRRPRQV